MFVALLIPGLIIVSFFIIQKLQYGWFFFPEHIGLIDTNLNDFSAKFQSMLFVIFIEEKRKWLWMIIGVSAVFYSIRKKKYTGFLFVLALAMIFAFKNIPLEFLKKPIITIAFITYTLFICARYWCIVSRNEQHGRFIIIAAAFSIVYLIFCSVNFYTVRYLMPVLLLSLFAFAFWLDTVIKDTGLKFYLPFTIIVLTLTIQSYLKNNDIGDTGLGSYSALKVQQGIISFLVNHNAQKSQIGINSFQQTVNMKNPACGFIKDNHEPFQNIRWEIDANTDYAVFDNIEPDSRYEAIRNDKNFVLIYEIHEQKVRGIIYKRIKGQ